jgi:hypothetical protein
MENHLDIKEKNNSVLLTHYASGDGSLSLSFKKNYLSSHDASEIKVSYRDVEAYQKKSGLEDWKIFKHTTGVYVLFQPMERLSDDEILFKNKIYYYSKNPLITAWNDYIIYVEDEDGKRQEIRNENIKSAIRFWLDNVGE